MADKIRILLAEDHAILREGLAALLDAEPDMEVVAKAATGRKAVDLYRAVRPDVGLIDLEMPDGDGAEAISIIRSFDSRAKLVVVTSYMGEEDVFRAVSAGARGYVLKAEEPEKLLACIRTVFSGGRYIPAAVAEKLADRLPGNSLSKRELEVLRLLVEGQNNAEIAGSLGISEATVKFHVNRLFSKLRVQDRTQAVVAALRNGLARLSWKN